MFEAKSLSSVDSTPLSVKALHIPIFQRQDIEGLLRIDLLFALRDFIDGNDSTRTN